MKKIVKNHWKLSNEFTKIKNTEYWSKITKEKNVEKYVTIKQKSLKIIENWVKFDLNG